MAKKGPKPGTPNFSARKFNETTKYCPGCDAWLLHEAFSIHKGTPSGLGNYCRACTRRLSVFQKFGLTAEEHKAILERQKYSCANTGCGASVDISSDIDHDRHCCPSDLKTCGNCVRGILCKNCNKVLGFFSDDIEKLKGAILYLENCKSEGQV